jgi:hypothetical protein
MTFAGAILPSPRRQAIRRRARLEFDQPCRDDVPSLGRNARGLPLLVVLMKIAVITPYCREIEPVLLDCHRSVLAQTVPCTHVMVADGCPSQAVQSWKVDHVILPRPHADYGSTPRLVGAYHAVGLGFDGVAFLDADNWYRHDHLETLLELHRRTHAPLLASSRMLCRLDGSIIGPCETSHVDKFIDTSCMLLMRPAFELLANWCLMPAYAHVISDRVFLYLARAAGMKLAHSPEITLYYRCGKSDSYDAIGEVPPPGARPPPDYWTAFRRWVDDGFPPLI